MKFVTWFLIFNLFILKVFAKHQSIIPTQTEQADLLLNVQEVFEQVKLLTKDEADSTDISVVGDIELMVKRARYILNLLEGITLLRLSCDNNSVCMLTSKDKIKQLVKNAENTLEECTRQGSEAIKINSEQLANTTNSAIDRGQLLLDALGNCSRKPGLAVISCYRNIITTDVVPVKKTFIEAIQARQEGHSEAIKIRNKANACVDDIISKYRDIIDEELEVALKCT